MLRARKEIDSPRRRRFSACSIARDGVLERCGAAGRHGAADRLVRCGGDGLMVRFDPARFIAVFQHLQQRLNRHPALQRRLRRPACIQIGTRSQHQLLGGVDLLPSADQRGEALLRGLHRALHASPGETRQLDSLAVASVGHLLTASVTDPHHECALAGDLRDIRISGGGAVRAQGAVENGQGARDLRVVVQVGEPGGRRRERGGRDHGRTRCRHRFRLGGRERARAAASQARPLRRPQGRQHQHRLDERVGGGADQVAPVGRTEQEAELELDEAEGAVAVVG